MKPEQPARRFIMVVLARSSTTELRYKIMDEADGPAETDCPLRILKAADLYPAADETAANWRKACRKQHEDARQFSQILKQIEEQPQHADRRGLLAWSNCRLVMGQNTITQLVSD